MAAFGGLISCPDEKRQCYTPGDEGRKIFHCELPNLGYHRFKVEAHMQSLWTSYHFSIRRHMGIWKSTLGTTIHTSPNY